MKKIIVLLCSLLLFFPLRASHAKTLARGLDEISSKIEKGMPATGKAKIAVVDFVDINEKQSDIGKYLAEEPIGRLVSSGRFDIVERKFLKKLLEEHSLNLSGMIDVNTEKKAGAAGLFIEDQTYPKRCGHMAGKSVVSVEEYLPKLKAALWAKQERSPKCITM
jgi:curli biogenesis system outer membrane secretion channel CsgG